jgi:dihydrofolate reductase
MKISMIAAIGKNRELGKDNKIPWHIPEDFTWFKEKTQGHVVIMGRKTFESIGKPLPKRTNIVITREKEYTAEGIIVVHSLEEALAIPKEKEESFLKEEGKEPEVFIIGGAQIFTEGMQYADRLYITLIDHTFDADTFFPAYPEFTKVIFEKKGESGGYKYTFYILEK